MRIFFAISLPDETKSRIYKFSNEVIYPILKGIKKVSIENLHITLKFIGEVEESTVKLLRAELIKPSRHTSGSYRSHRLGAGETVVNSTTDYANSDPPITVEINGLGVFPNANRARVLWIGTNCFHLNSIYNHIQATLKKLNISTEDEKKFHPHITLGRFKESPNVQTLQPLLEKYKNKSFEKFEINSFTLYKSTLTPEKPIYTPLYDFRL